MIHAADHDRAPSLMDVRGVEPASVLAREVKVREQVLGRGLKQLGGFRQQSQSDGRSAGNRTHYQRS